jgi:hypothetical protein
MRIASFDILSLISVLILSSLRKDKYLNRTLQKYKNKEHKNLTACAKTTESVGKRRPYEFFKIYNFKIDRYLSFLKIIINNTWTLTLFWLLLLIYAHVQLLVMCGLLLSSSHCFGLLSSQREGS